MDVWTQTEGDDQYEFDFLAEGDIDSPWLGGHHQKWVALLTKEQFVQFAYECYLTADNVQTMGSIGAPGFGFGLAPAISFDGSSAPDGWSNAYVTPIPIAKIPEDLETLDESVLSERNWERVRKVVIEVFS